MKKIIKYLLCGSLFFITCKDKKPTIEYYGQHYQQHFDFRSLHKVVELLPANADTNLVRKLLGDPIDMGFDFRYVVDSTGENGCVIGGVFHIAEGGIIDQKWTGEICE